MSEMMKIGGRSPSSCSTPLSQIARSVHCTQHYRNFRPEHGSPCFPPLMLGITLYRIWASAKLPRLRKINLFLIQTCCKRKPVFGTKSTLDAPSIDKFTPGLADVNITLRQSLKCSPVLPVLRKRLADSPSHSQTSSTDGHCCPPQTHHAQALPVLSSPPAGTPRFDRSSRATIVVNWSSL